MTFDNELDKIVQQIVEFKKKDKTEAEIKAAETIRMTQEFEEHFKDIYDKVQESIAIINDKLQSQNIKLEIVNGVEDKTANLKAVQIFINDEDKQSNVLEYPSLLIEGIVNNGAVRIVASGSTEEGQITKISEVNTELINNQLSSFLVKSLASNAPV